MYFVLSKVIGFFAVPTNVITFVALAALIAMITRQWYAHHLVIIALTIWVVAAFSPLGTILLTPLEQRFPSLRYPQHQIAGIIVLGGSYDGQTRGYISTIILHEDTDRMAVIAGLAKQYPDAKVIFSGGSGSLFGKTGSGPGEAAIARKLFISFGIEAKRITVEDQSRNTEENARFTAQLIKPKPGSTWLLVTSAYHMPRAMGTFRKSGFNVIAFPVGWRTHGWWNFYWPAATATENFRRIDVAMREWIGLTMYRLLGFSNEWFPGP